MEAAIGGVIVGAAVAVFAPSLVNGVVSVLRPIAKEVIKVGVVAYDTVAEAVSGTTDCVKELVDEARHEMKAGASKGQGRTSR